MSKDSISSKQEFIPAQNQPVPNPFEGVDFQELELSLIGRATCSVPC